MGFLKGISRIENDSGDHQRIILPCLTNDYISQALVDTGAEVSLIQKDYCTNIGVEIIDIPYTLNAFNGSQESAAGMASICLKVKNCSPITANFVVVNHLEPKNTFRNA